MNNTIVANDSNHNYVNSFIYPVLLFGIPLIVAVSIILYVYCCKKKRRIQVIDFDPSKVVVVVVKNDVTHKSQL